MNRPHTVYSLRDADDRILYIGCTDNIPSRMSCHKGNKPWWPEVARIGTEFTGDRDASYRRERELIGQLQPPYNVRHTSRDPVPSFRPGHQLALAPQRSTPAPNPDRELIASLVRYELAKPRVGTREVADLLDINIHAARRRLSGEVPFRADELLVLSRLLSIHPGRFLQDAAATTPPTGIPAAVAEAVS
jgi:hypothetical protein